MSTFVVRAYDYFLSPSKDRRPSAGSNQRQSLTSLDKAKSTSNGNGKPKKTKTKSNREDSSKSYRVSKHANDNSSSKKKTKRTLQKWNLANLPQSYEQAALTSDEDDHEDSSFEGETFAENKENTMEIKREAESEDENATLVEEEDSQSPTEAEDVSITEIQARILEADDPRIEDWSEDEIWVFNKLVMRGREPLLPFELSSEFPSWPDMLFTRNSSKIVIGNHRCSMTNRNSPQPPTSVSQELINTTQSPQPSTASSTKAAAHAADSSAPPPRNPPSLAP